MRKSKIQADKTVRTLLILSFALAIMVLARSILIPLVFGFFLALLLEPVSSFFNKKLPNLISILFTFILLLSLIGGIIFFFGTQFYNLFEDIKNFGTVIQDSLNNFINRVDESLMPENLHLGELVESSPGELIASNHIIANTISISANFVIVLGLVLVYAFFFLLYRNSFNRFILSRFKSEKNEYAASIIEDIRKVVQNYFIGLLIVIAILGTLNGAGLYVIGLDYPFLFGFFAAFLAIVPYIGSFLGGLFPTIYALINGDTLWQAVFVVLWYVFVQVLEGNFLTPKIVGSKVSLNPLVAIIAILTGGLIWGIAGMVLFIPLLAIVKVVFDNIEPMKPYGLLLSSKFGNSDTDFSLLKEAKKKLVKTIKNELD